MAINSVTPQLEKVFLHWILKNSHLFKIVSKEFFKNEEIKFIYDSIKNEWMTSTDKLIPSKKEIYTLIRTLDPTEKISDDLILAILKNDMKDYREEFIIPRFNAWVLSNSAISGLVDAIEEIKNVDRINFDAVSASVEKVKALIHETTTIDLGTQDIGIDFDDPEAHNQEAEIVKIKTGYGCLDSMLDGGMDRKTLSLLVGSPGSGKSLWGQNIAVNVANQGYNVLFITLELSDKKVLKRTGAMRLGIPIKDYAEWAKDKEAVKERIDYINKKNNGIFDSKPGKLWIKEFPSGSATVNDIENTVKLVMEKTGMKVDFLVVDYIQIMRPEKALQIDNMLYLKGKHLAEGLRSIAQRYELASLSMTQVAKEKYGANDINLNDMPESKAMADTADTVLAIILTPPMKIEGKYQLKKLKLRDSDCEYERIGFTFNKVTLKIENEDYFLENVL